MKFTAQTVYNKERLLRFNRFVVFRKRVVWTIIIVCTVLATLVFALDIALNRRDSFSTFCFVFVWALDIIYVFCSFILPRITINKAVNLNNNIVYQFEQNSFTITANSEKVTENSKLNYSAIMKVIESEKDIFLFISSRQAYIVDKSSFMEGSPEEFINFLKEKKIPYEK